VQAVHLLAKGDDHDSVEYLLLLRRADPAGDVLLRMLQRHNV
jgi:hypothetical protein